MLLFVAGSRRAALPCSWASQQEDFHDKLWFVNIVLKQTKTCSWQLRYRSNQKSLGKNRKTANVLCFSDLYENWWKLCVGCRFSGSPGLFQHLELSIEANTKFQEECSNQMIHVLRQHPKMLGTNGNTTRDNGCWACTSARDISILGFLKDPVIKASAWKPSNTKSYQLPGAPTIRSTTNSMRLLMSSPCCKAFQKKNGHELSCGLCCQCSYVPDLCPAIPSPSPPVRKGRMRKQTAERNARITIGGKNRRKECTKNIVKDHYAFW